MRVIEPAILQILRPIGKMMVNLVVFDYHIIFQDASILQFYDGLVRRDSIFCRLEAANLEAAIFEIHDSIVD
jgi:hypothetical protein